SDSLRVYCIRSLFGRQAAGRKDPRGESTEKASMALTKRQKQILDYVESFIENYGYSPSFEAIAAFFGYSSLATVHEHLSNLERKGYLRKTYNKSRSLELVPAEGTLAVDLPLLGTVAAGLPI